MSHSNPAAAVDLSCQDLRKYDVSEVALRGAKLQDANLAGADLRGPPVAATCRMQTCGAR